MKNKPRRDDYKVRELPPGIHPTKAGVEVLCPFCTPPHPILPGTQYPCGTSLKVTAVQTILTTHGSKQQGIKCIKCKQIGGGDMVRMNSGFVHLIDCAPGVKMLSTLPKFNRMARLVFAIPKSIRKHIEEITGVAEQVKEVDAEGTETGKVIGYFFWKGNKHGTHPDPG